MIKCLLYTCLVLAFSLSGVRAEYSEVHVAVKGETGEVVNWAGVSLIELGTKQRHTGKYDSDADDYVFNVPFGRYLLEIQAEGFETHEQRTRIAQSRVFFRVGLILGKIHGQRPIVLSGKVIGHNSRSADTWVTVIPLLASDCRMDYRVDSSGHFVFTDISIGKYLIVVTESPVGGHSAPAVVLMQESVVAKSSEITLEIDR